MAIEKILKNLVCPKCHGEFRIENKKFSCLNCGKAYKIRNGKLYFLEAKTEILNQESNDFIINRLKILFKKYPRIFSFLYCVFGALFVGKSAEEVIKNMGSEKIIINLGSGIKRINEKVINIDFYPFNNVGIVADITKLPFKDNSVDVIICESVLEHVKNPWAIVQEIKRVLKLGGLVYISVPFIASFHSSPNDYYRWSKQGLRELLKKFKEEEIGIRSGPTSSLFYVISEWLATFLSFGSQKIHQILLILFIIIFTPIKILDYLIYKFKSSENIAYAFYYIGRKK
jgi:SAM-dependent methyltransferase